MTGCAREPLDVAVPEVDGQTAAVCRALSRALPAELDGRERTAIKPKSAQTAAWGKPPLVLRCGVGKPPRLAPDSEIIEVNGVEWFLSETSGDEIRAYTFTTVGRVAYVELSVPSTVERSEATAPLVDLADAVQREVPVAPAR